MACPKIYRITIPAWLSFVRRPDPIQQMGHSKQHGEDAQENVGSTKELSMTGSELEEG